MTDPRKILYVGEVGPGTTCAMRAKALEDLGHLVDIVSVCPVVRPKLLVDLCRRAGNRLRRPLDLAGVNRAILERAAGYDILWIDKGNVISRRTLTRVRSQTPRPVIIGFSPDDMEQRHCTSVWFHSTLPLYDAYITTKSFQVAELERRGCPLAVFIDNAYDPRTHRPLEVNDEMRMAHEGAAGFVGFHEHERERSISYLADAGVAVHVYGPGWALVRRRLPAAVRIHPAVFGDDYARVLCATPINLGFLRKCNRDLQTTRSVEIPACGGFMLAERTPEHQRLFREGEEAEYFADDDELVRKTMHYLAHTSERLAIARRGRSRCLTSRYSYAERLSDALAVIDQHMSCGMAPSPLIQR
jgi:spore maturation protein CgeB